MSPPTSRATASSRRCRSTAVPDDQPVETLLDDPVVAAAHPPGLGLPRGRGRRRLPAGLRRQPRHHDLGRHPGRRALRQPGRRSSDEHPHLRPGRHPARRHARRAPPHRRPTDVKRIVVALDDAGRRRDRGRPRRRARRLARSTTARARTPTGNGSRRRPRSSSAPRSPPCCCPASAPIDDLEHAYDLGVRSVRIATHCTEADISAQHIAAARELGMDVSGFLMLSHMAEPEQLAQQAKLMESYGAHCVYVTDSGGRLTMDDVAARVKAYRDVLDADTADRHPRPREPLAVGRQLARRRRERRRTASTRRWPATVPVPATAPSRPSSPSPTCPDSSTAATCSRCRTPPTTSSVRCRTARSGSTARR